MSPQPEQKIAHFFTTEWGNQSFDTFAEVQNFAEECEGSAGQIMEFWQTEDGEVFETAEAAEQHVRDNAALSFDWDGYNAKGVEMFGLFPA